jgi:hypothetical protein
LTLAIRNHRRVPLLKTLGNELLPLPAPRVLLLLPPLPGFFLLLPHLVEFSLAIPIRVQLLLPPHFSSDHCLHLAALHPILTRYVPRLNFARRPQIQGSRNGGLP